MADRFDLGAARTERAGDPVPFTYFGIDFEVPPEIPLLVGELAAKNDIRAAVAVLTGNDDISLELLGNGFSQEDLVLLVKTAYPGIDLPESLASLVS